MKHKVHAHKASDKLRHPQEEVKEHPDLPGPIELSLTMSTQQNFCVLALEAVWRV